MTRVIAFITRDFDGFLPGSGVIGYTRTWRLMLAIGTRDETAMIATSSESVRVRSARIDNIDLAILS